ncbi:hypothetical protein KI387_001976, partial [Taxus chinensis]
NARIVIDKFHIVLHSSDSIAPVGILHPSVFYLKIKEANVDPGLGNEESPTNRSVTNRVIEVKGNYIPGNCIADNWLKALPVQPVAKYKLNLVVSKTQSDVLTIRCWVQNMPESMEGIEIYLGLVLKGLQCRLKEDQIGWEDVLYIHLYLADMNQFALANDTYLRYITEENCPRGVPSRSTIEIPLVKGDLGKAFIEVFAAKDKTKKVLHVQSVSCWAPSCIGPYSQATLHRQILYMAGQLGLDPPTMMLSSGGAGVQMQQALINCEAVAKAFGCNLISSLISLTVYCPIFLTSCERSEIGNILEKYMHKGTTVGGYSNIITENSTYNQAPILYILTSMLPKGALVEVKPVLYVPLLEEDSYSDDESVDNITRDIDTDINDTGGFGHDQLASSCCESFDVCGRLCAATLTLTSDAVYKICTQTLDDLSPTQSKNSSIMVEQKKSLTNIAKFCLYVLHKRLQKACLFWEDVMNLRVYFVSNIVPIDKLRMAFTEATQRHEYNKEPVLYKNDTSFGSPVTSFIPVLGVGRNAEMTDIIT